MRECMAPIQIDCNNAPLNVGGVEYSWYNTNNKKYDGKQTFSGWLKNCDSGRNTQDDGKQKLNESVFMRPMYRLFVFLYAFI